MNSSLPWRVHGEVEAVLVDGVVHTQEVLEKVPERLQDCGVTFERFAINISTF